MPPSAPSRRVLLAASDPAAREQLTAPFRAGGWTVVSAGGGGEALAALAGDAFGLVVLVLPLADMDGLRVARLLRSREKVTGGRVPLLALTPDPSAERARCLASGVDECLACTASPGELAQVIGRLTGGEPGGVSPGSSEGWLEALQDLGFEDEALQDVAQAFVANVPARLAALREAHAAGDAGRVADEAHALSGSLLVFAADSAVAVARRLESLGREGRLGPAEELELLEGEALALLRSVQSFLASAP
jgi:CheY-like chemotaxis protein